MRREEQQQTNKFFGFHITEDTGVDTPSPEPLVRVHGGVQVHE
jgi:hypothetical protein